MHHEAKGEQRFNHQRNKNNVSNIIQVTGFYGAHLT